MSTWLWGGTAGIAHQLHVAPQCCQLLGNHLLRIFQLLAQLAVSGLHALQLLAQLLLADG
jgi:hypothetical protein